MVVVVGFFATVQLLIVQAGGGAAPIGRTAVTLALALSFAVRYWWVILLLQWPFQWFRTVLLLLAWVALPVVAMAATDPVRWALAVAALSTIGCITEIYNGVTRQWLVGSGEMARSLKRDHISGAASAGAAAIFLSVLAFLRPVWVDVVILLMVVADWARLITMIRRHQRFVDLGYLT
ncbi:MAG TPA: hypothetical protein VF887_06995 [Gemmatimonadaceae bacterium]